MKKDPTLQVETTCGSLLYELQIIWGEVGETETDRDKMLLELELECVEVYRRKVDQANRCRAQLRQAIADAEAELAALCSAMGERPVHIRQSDQSVGSLKQELGTILPELEEMQKRKTERRNQFVPVLEEIVSIANDIRGQGEDVPSKPRIDETDLSMRKLEELQCQLRALQKEKSDRVETIRKHMCSLYSHCSVLGMDCYEVVGQVNPTLNDPEGPRSLSDHTIEKLGAAVQKLREVKIQRMQKLQDLATTMLELWNFMDTPIEEQQEYQHITSNVAASEHEITEANSLSEDFIKYVEAEVFRLDKLKASKMKELVLKKRSELEDICRKTHMLPVSGSAIEPNPHESVSPSIQLGSSKVLRFSSQCTDDPSLGEDTPTERRKRRKWTPTDDAVLISAWLNTSKGVVGNEQKLGAFWKRIAAYFASSPQVVGYEKREPSHCKQRWHKINDLVCKFCGSYDAAKREKGSGHNENDVLELAHQIFYSDHKKRFNIEHAWKKLRNDQKWCDLSSSKTDGSSKRRKCEDGAQSSSSHTVNSVDDQATNRCPSVKTMKGKGKRNMEEGKTGLEFQSMGTIKEDLVIKEKLSKMGLLDSLLAKKEPLSEIEEALKNKLITDMLTN
uniref:65-kDa microtubule-associated protein 3 n=1 Tax=Noccaea caerulescens TaxID=107243 RepID=A0A1J3HR31_NOCCA